MAHVDTLQHGNLLIEGTDCPVLVVRSIVVPDVVVR